MNIKEVIATINPMQADGVMDCYAIGGAVGTTFYLQSDHSVRHYLYQNIDGLALDALDNTNVETIN